MVAQARPIDANLLPRPARAGLLRRIEQSGVPVLLLRLGVGGYFMLAALLKMRDPIGFIKSVNQYHFWPVDPPNYLNLTALLVPGLELVCGAALVLGLFRRGAALLIAGMLVFFTWLIAGLALGEYHDPTGGAVYASFFDVRIGCGCLGNEKVNAVAKLAENTGLFLASLLALFGTDRFGLDRLLFRHSHSAGGPRISNQ